MLWGIWGMYGPKKLEFTEINYIEQIKKFQIDRWRMLSLKEKEDVMQWIVDYKANEFGLPSICNIKIIELNGGRQNGEFVHKTHAINIEKELAVDLLKPPYHQKEKIVHQLANKEIFEILMHEFAHAMQQYVVENPKIYENDEFYQKLMLNRDLGQNSDLKAYFTLSSEKNFRKQQICSLLYRLQFSERQAFEFADQECKKFNETMKLLFPEDLAFAYHDSFSQFSKSIEEAKYEFNTDTPYEDIDDIIRVINYLEPLKPLNQEMWQAVIETQQQEKENVLKKLLGRFTAEKDNETEIEDLQIGNR